MTTLIARKARLKRAIQETLYLVSIPGMRDSIQRGLKTPIRQCREILRWLAR